MRTPLFAMSLDELVSLGHYHVITLGRSEETKALIAEFAPVLDFLDGAAVMDRRGQRDLKQALLAWITAEATLREIIQRVALLAHGPDYRETPAYRALFPNGIDVDLPPVEGHSHIAVALALRERLVSHPALVDIKAQVIADFDKALTDLSQAVAAHEHAEQVATRARAWGEKKRTEFLAAYQRNAVAIAKIFPDDQRRQNVYFDERFDDRSPIAGGPDGWPSIGKNGSGKLS